MSGLGSAPPSPPERPRTGRSLELVVASAALAAIATHDLGHLRDGRWYDVFWVCNVAAVAAPLGLVARSAHLSAAALTWIVPGTAVWLIDALVAGSSIIPSSYLAHFGGLATALFAVWRTGPARYGWLAALALLCSCLLASWLFLPSAANVNAVHAVPRGWTALGSGRGGFVLTASALALAVCALGHAMARWLGALGARRRGVDRVASGAVDPL